jgi:hypothetical protein
MESLFASGLIVDFVIGLVIVEGCLLSFYRWRIGHGPNPADLVATLASGLCLLLALRGALIGAPWQVDAAWLAASGVAHLADLRRRFGR